MKHITGIVVKNEVVIEVIRQEVILSLQHSFVSKSPHWHVITMTNAKEGIFSSSYATMHHSSLVFLVLLITWILLQF